MSDPYSITADAYEILVSRELRKAGIEPIGLRRRARGDQFDLLGHLRAYDQRWSVLIECRTTPDPVSASDVQALHKRAKGEQKASVILCTTSQYESEAVKRASECAVLLLRVVDAQSILVADGVIAPGQLPAWVPEFTVQIVSERAQARPTLLEPDQPELILRELRAPGLR